MEPFKDMSRVVPPSTTEGVLKKAPPDDSPSDEFSRLFDQANPDPMDPDDPIKRYIVPGERAVDERFIIPRGPTHGLVLPGSVDPATVAKNPPPVRPSHGHSPGLPIPPDPGWRPPPPATHEVVVHHMPRKKRKHDPDARVDGELIEALLAAGLKDPVASLQDPRMKAESPFNALTGWSVLMGEATMSATWRASGIHQICIVGEGRRMIETRAGEKSQHIEERQGQVSVSRGTGPPPEFHAET